MSITNTIFYSWQSDLPSKHNRGFIEDCLKKVVKEVSSLGPFDIQLNVDRDTLNTTGTPSIIDSIFEKIDRAKLFIADISIINADSDGRKMPNPNVLVELGYAAKALGWEKVICIYNTDFGGYDDLPFDLRQRRPLSYSLTGKVKAEVQKNLVRVISDNIRRLNRMGSLHDTVSDFLKVQVDTEILTIVGHLRKLLFGYSPDRTLKGDAEFFYQTDEQLRSLLSSGKFLGFQAFKKFAVQEDIMTKLAHQTLSSPHHAKAVAAIIIEYVTWIGRFDKFNSLRTQSPVFIKTATPAIKDHKAIRGTEINPENRTLPDRFFLLKKIDEKNSKVVDFGDFVETPKIQGLLHRYTIAPAHIENYVSLLRDFIDLSERWLDVTNGEFIVDNVKMFELKRVTRSQ